MTECAISMSIGSIFDLRIVRSLVRAIDGFNRLCNGPIAIRQSSIAESPNQSLNQSILSFGNRLIT